jgi:flagellar biosynthesis/type III secretory pathway protein FliH
MINPADFALFESHRDALMVQSRELESIEIVQDNTIKSGVMVETDAGLIDATVQTRLELIDNEFRNAA